MGLFDHFPYTNVHELNLDWILSMMRALEAEWESFTAGNSLTFADPLQHDISKTYAKNTIVLDGNGNAYVSLKAVPVGVPLSNSEYWLMVFDYEAFIEKVNKNFTARYYRNQYRATAAMVIGDWLTVDDVLCKATAAIAADDVLEVGVNIDHFTLEDFIKAFMQSANDRITQMFNDFTAAEAQHLLDVQAEIDRILAGATVDSEVIDARLGANGINYTTLGNAIRGQFDNVDVINNIEPIVMSDGYIDTDGGGSIDLTPTVVTTRKYAVVSCSEGDVFSVIGQGGNHARLISFLDSNNVVIWQEYSNATYDDYVVCLAPSGSAKLVINAKTEDLTSYKGILPVFNIDYDKNNSQFNPNWSIGQINTSTGDRETSPRQLNAVTDYMDKNDCSFIYINEKSNSFVTEMSIAVYDDNKIYQGKISSDYTLTTTATDVKTDFNRFSTDFIPDNYYFRVIVKFDAEPNDRNAWGLITNASKYITFLNYGVNLDVFKYVPSNTYGALENSLNNASGQEGWDIVVNPNRAHTDYIPIYGTKTVMVNGGYTFKLAFYYDENFNFIRRGLGSGGTNYYEITEASASYVRFILSNVDDTTPITDVTDIELTVYGAVKTITRKEVFASLLRNHTPIDPDWSGWSDGRNAYGFNTETDRIFEKLNGMLEADMFSVVTGKGRWSHSTNFTYGSHFFEAWNKLEKARYTGLIGKFDPLMACLFVFSPPNINEGVSSYGYLKLGSDNKDEGINIGRKSVRSFVPICLSTTQPSDVDLMEPEFGNDTTVPVGAIYFDEVADTINVMTSNGWKSVSLD